MALLPRLRLGSNYAARLRLALKNQWYRTRQQFAFLTVARAMGSATAATAKWLLIYIVPALATGLVFAAALGRYTTETQFAQNAFQSYLRPYQTQYKQCLLQMDALRDRWENLELLLRFARNTDRGANAPVVVFTHEGSISSTDKDDDAEKVLGRIVTASRRASTCMDETIRQGEELATLLGQKTWFRTEVSNREQRLAEYQTYIAKTWASISDLPKWELVGKAILRARDGEVLPAKSRTEAEKYAVAVDRFRAHLFESHARTKVWFERLDTIFRDELAARSSRTIGHYLRNIVQDILPIAPTGPVAAVPLPDPSLAWVTPIDKDPPSVHCNCSRPFAGGNFQRLGDPP